MIMLQAICLLLIVSFVANKMKINVVLIAAAFLLIYWNL